MVSLPHMMPAGSESNGLLVVIRTRDDARFGCIDLDTLESNQDKTVECRTVSGSKELYLKKGEHMLLIKYT